ncbi:hypothetical protein GCM10007972_11800 [Iodidimonas muriae]|uniref:Coiled coil domain-containing protein n=1 Tax=Iodidimonas muriae TaxID=261467 RepID=A0ABQ2LD24_9PROT|nr:hypothetical protein [Iodidimonas muriae]GER06831.1 hypothetical protein JCM17843_11410 [Kordiimonadales bacterium JCM 17843]GGO09837.1 hypothetical protein GCM10007972_11800 [Iodidimonas muriae]
MAKSGQTYESLKATLDEWEAELEKMEAKARKFRAEKQAEFDSYVKQARSQRDEAHDRISKLQKASEHAMGDIRKGAEKALDDLNDAMKRARAHYR